MNDAPSQSTKGPNPPARTRHGKFNFWKWFWLSTIPVSLGWLWHDFYAPANNITWVKDYAAAEGQAARSGKPIILFFTGNWCSPCRIMKRNVWADRQVEATVNAQFTPVIIDVDDPHEATVLSRFQVRATPTTIITDPQGKVLQQVQGGVAKPQFLEMLARSSPSVTKD